MGADVEDYDNDGWPDVIVTTLSLERYALYRATGRGRFEYASHTSGGRTRHAPERGMGTKFIDFDNDGRRDLFVAQGHVLDTVSRARQGFDYLQPPLMLRTPPPSGLSFVDVSTSLGPAFTGRPPVAARLSRILMTMETSTSSSPTSTARRHCCATRGQRQPLADGVVARHAGEPAGIGAIVGIVDERGAPRASARRLELSVGERP